MEEVTRMPLSLCDAPCGCPMQRLTDHSACCEQLFTPSIQAGYSPACASVIRQNKKFTIRVYIADHAETRHRKTS